MSEAKPRIPNRDWVPVPHPDLADGPAHSWESQVVQYPVDGPPGVSYFAGEVPGALPVDCLLWRDEHGALRGILNHYSEDFGPERAGNVNLWVQPGYYGRGIATALALEVRRRWPDLDRQQQRYTEAGARFLQAYLRRHPNPDDALE